MDYQRFLDKREEQVLPYLGGAVVDAPGRALRVKAPVAPGWWRFELRGRDATALAPAEPSFDAALPRVRGHLLGPRLVAQQSVRHVLGLGCRAEDTCYLGERAAGTVPQGDGGVEAARRGAGLDADRSGAARGRGS